VSRSTDQDHPKARPPPPPLDKHYRRYARWLTAVLRKRFGAKIGPAEDLVQEAYLHAARHEERGALRHPRAFLLQVATNLARNEVRRVARSGLALAVDPHASIENSSEKAEHGVDAEQLEALLLKQLILSLPAPLKDVFVLSRYAELTNQEIAERCDLSVKTVEWRMTKALAHLRARLRD